MDGYGGGFAYPVVQAVIKGYLQLLKCWVPIKFPVCG
jgi:hypothetical protein